MTTPKSKAPTLTPIEQQAEDIVRAMVSQSWNEEIETIARLLRENERIQKTLWTATESAVSMAQGLDESKKLVAEKSQEIDQLKLQNERFREDIKRLNEESDRLVQDRAAAIRDQEHALNLYVSTKKQHDEAIWLMNKATLEFNKTRAQLAATEEALAQVQRESEELREERDQATREAKAYRADCIRVVDHLEEFEAAKKVADAAVEYKYGVFDGGLDAHRQRGHALADAVDEYRALIKRPPLANQAALDAALERLGDEEKLEGILMCKCGHSANLHGLPKGCVALDCPCRSFRLDRRR